MNIFGSRIRRDYSDENCQGQDDTQQGDQGEKILGNGHLETFRKLFLVDLVDVASLIRTAESLMMVKAG